ncbi:hypothetical protein KEM48_009748 [Puccinia striiformis f. sp. tritici PST-130]|nr:hypothetical protein KEM48_009748 [Puccinia striiformis f. sp. tritici PST-130]
MAIDAQRKALMAVQASVHGSTWALGSWIIVGLPLRGKAAAKSALSDLMASKFRPSSSGGSDHRAKLPQSSMETPAVDLGGFLAR